ncbi:uncharacterized protein LOC131627062 [Vicia villosa]|uniref:uncharacterized protein LOC131627062 n=1 Tax=Vicia villosa TaxID=3911 RepID=UPI00273B096E|nr:uncharacterized protein LOC131627062 [Vicia villosa]
MASNPLLGETGKAEDDTEADMLDQIIEDIDGMTVEESLMGGYECPNFVLSDREEKRIYRPWKRGAIVKLLGRKIGYKALENRLRQMWVKKGVISIIDLSNDYYLVAFSHEDDKRVAMGEGPWFIYDHYLTVKDWGPNFHPEKDAIEEVAVWIRNAGLPIEYYDTSVLTFIGNRLGKAVKVDKNTVKQERGKCCGWPVDGCAEATARKQVAGKKNSGPAKINAGNKLNGSRFISLSGKDQEINDSLKSIDGGMIEIDGAMIGGIPKKASVEYEKNKKKKEVVADINKEREEEILNKEVMDSLHGMGINEAIIGGEKETRHVGRQENNRQKTKSINAKKVMKLKLATRVTAAFKGKGVSGTKHAVEGGLGENQQKVVGPYHFKNNVHKGKENMKRDAGVNKFHMVDKGESFCIKYPDINTPQNMISSCLDIATHTRPSDMDIQVMSSPPDMIREEAHNETEEKGFEENSSEGKRQHEDMEVNCRGAAGKAFYRYSKHYIDLYRPTMFVVMETRCDPAKLTKKFKIMGFDEMIYMENQGYEGGIIAGWKKQYLSVKLEKKDLQYLHLKIESHQAKHWYFTAVYASPNEVHRQALWEELKITARGMKVPWLVAGDFNEIASIGDKKGGVPASARKFHNFRDRINQCKLMDLGASGPRFTWRGPLYHGGQRIYEKLDRAMCNDMWRLEFPNAYVKVLARVEFSDHHPLMITLDHSLNRKEDKKFRFESAWLLNDSYHDMLKKAWQEDKEIYLNLKHVQDNIKEWKEDTMEQASRRKRRIMARLGGIQTSLQRNSYNPGLEKLEQTLQAEMTNILKKEEVMWFQRSRAEWLINGDRNTKYYHMKAVTRR